MRANIRFLFFLPVLVAVLIIAQPIARADTYTGVPLDQTAWGIEYQGRTYDSENDTTTFCYEATVDGDHGFHYIIFELSPKFELVSTTPAEPVEFLDKPDPITSVLGLKYAGGQAAAAGTYCFTLKGNIAEGPINYGFKGNPVYVVGQIMGPVAGRSAVPFILPALGGAGAAGIDGGGDDKKDDPDPPPPPPPDPVPEPATVVLLGGGLIGVGAYRKREALKKLLKRK